MKRHQWSDDVLLWMLAMRDEEMGWTEMAKALCAAGYRTTRDAVKCRLLRIDAELAATEPKGR